MKSRSIGGVATDVAAEADGAVVAEEEAVAEIAADDVGAVAADVYVGAGADVAAGGAYVGAAAEVAVEGMRAVPGAIMPFPGGVVRSGSKVGSKYKGAVASTNHLYCPTLKGATDSVIGPEIGSVLDIVIDGLTSDAVAAAMRAGLKAIADLGPARGALRVGAGNYGGKLGKHHYRLRELMP